MARVKFQLIDCEKCHQRSLVPIALDQRPRGMARRDRRYFARVAKQFQAELMEGPAGACPKCGAPVSRSIAHSTCRPSRLVLSRISRRGVV